jgi:hypothetical protein
MSSAPLTERSKSDYHGVAAIFHALDGDAGAMEQSIAAELEISENLGHFHHAMCYIAAARAVIGQHDEAIDMLARASDEGFPCYPWFERDPLLESIRGMPRFIALIAELRSRWG